VNRGLQIASETVQEVGVDIRSALTGLLDSIDWGPDTPVDVPQTQVPELPIIPDPEDLGPEPYIRPGPEPQPSPSPAPTPAPNPYVPPQPARPLPIPPTPISIEGGGTGGASGPDLEVYCRPFIEEALNSGDDSNLPGACRRLYEEHARGRTTWKGSRPAIRSSHSYWGDRKGREHSTKNRPW
jgi:hypothetical protein